MYRCESSEVLTSQYLTVSVREMAVQLRLEFLFEEDYCGSRKSMPRFGKKKTEISLLQFNRPFTTFQSVSRTRGLIFQNRVHMLESDCLL